MKQDSLLNRFASLMIKKYRFVYLAMIIVVLMGMISYQGLPKEVLPEMRFPYAIVTVPYPGASPEDVEKQISKKVEEAVSGTGEIKTVETVALPGISQTVIKYKMGVDLSKKLEKVKEQVEEIRSELPKKHERPIVEEYDVTKIPTMILTLSSDGSPAALKQRAKDLSDRIKRIEGVSKVNIIGDQEREIQIRVDSLKLQQFGLLENDIAEAIKNRNIDMPAGLKTMNGKSYNVRINNAFENIEDIKRLVVKVSDGMPLYLEDLADVTYAYKKDDGYAIAPFKFKQEDEIIKKIVMLNVMKENATDTIRINDEIRQVTSTLQAETEFIGTEIEYPLDMSEYISKSIKDVFDNAVSGLLVVIIVLFFFIDFRESVIVALVIPLSMLMTVSTFKYVGVSFNVMSLLGLIIALGMLVDNAIVVIESIQLARLKESNLEKASEEATKSVAAAILASTVTTVVAFLPLTLMKGDMGIFIRPIPIATSIALVASYIVSIAVTPMLAARWLKNEKNDKKWIKWLGVIMVFFMSLFAFSNNGKITLLAMITAPSFTLAIWYKLFKSRHSIHEAPFIGRFINRLRVILTNKRMRIGVLMASILFVAASAGILISDLVPKEAMPTADTTQIEVSYKITVGSTLEDNEAVARQVHTILKEKSYVKNYVAGIGGNQENQGTLNITLVHKRDRDIHSNDIILELNRAFKEIPGAEFVVGSEDGGTSTQVSIELSGKDLSNLKTTADAFKSVISSYNAVEALWTSVDGGVPQVIVDIDHEKAAHLSLNPTVMSFEITEALRGNKLTEIISGEEEENIKLITSSVSEMKDLENLVFTNGRGQKIPFRDVAKIIEKSGMNKIKRKDNQKIISVVLQLKKGMVVKSVVEQIKTDLSEDTINVEDGVKVDFGGSYKEMQDSFKDLSQKMVIAITLIFAVLVLQFDSYKQPFVIMMAVPMAIIGVSFGHLVSNVSFGIMSFMGLVALSGIVVNDSIVLIDTINQNRKEHGMTYLEAIIDGTRSRFIPVIATSVTTIAGVLPLALYNEDYSQMAWTLIFGLTTSTVLILGLVPIILAQMEGRKIENE